ncbi:MAG: STAS domain-containing protein [Acidobacteriota bacterium]
MALRIEAKESDGVTVVTLAGRVTLGDESNQLRNKIKDLLTQGKNRMVLDLGEVSYIDSAGLGALVSAYTSARSGGGEIKLASVTKKFHELLNITKLVTIFDVHGSVADAVKAFS